MHDIHAEITNQIIEQLERLQDQPKSQFTLPWHHPHGGFPKNALTERAYRGSNCIILWVMAQARGRLSNRWATYKQWQKLGGQVRKGERSIKITVPLIFKDHDRDHHGDEDAETRIRFTAGNIFNEDQVDLENAELAPLDEPDISDIDPITPHEYADQIIEATGAVIKTEGYRAFYKPIEDIITMPDRALFKGSQTMSATEGWYATLLHELVHWSGHRNRLARDGVATISQSKEVYAFEELIAEFGSAFLCARTGITPLLRDDHRHYIAGWIKALQSDGKALFKASAAADKAADYLWSHQSYTQQDVA